MLHRPTITVPPVLLLADLTIDELSRESQRLLELAHNANSMGDLMGAATMIGRGFRVSRELRLRYARIEEAEA